MSKPRILLNLLGGFLVAFVLTTCVVAAIAQPPQEIFCRHVRVLSIDSAQGTVLAAIGPPAIPDSVGEYRVPRWPFGVLCSEGGAP